MKKLHRTSLAISAIVFGLGASANLHAEEILAGGGVAGGPLTAKALCNVFNGDANTIKISEKLIYGQFSSPSTYYYNDCGANLASGKICSFAANIQNNQQYACKVAIIGSKSNVRGNLLITDEAGNVLVSTPLN